MKTARFVRELTAADGWQSATTTKLYALSEPHTYIPAEFEQSVPPGATARATPPPQTSFLAVSSSPQNRLTRKPQTVVLFTDESGRPPQLGTPTLCIQALIQRENAFAEALLKLGYAEVFVDLATGPDTQVTSVVRADDGSYYID